MKSAVVTGVSTGIGHGTTKVLISKGWRVFGSVRKAEDAERLKREFGDLYHPLMFDVRDENAIEAAAAETRAALEGSTLQGLVNNAGIALDAPALMQPVAEFRRQLEVNLIGLFAVTRAFGPLLGVDATLSGPKGRIVNISSEAGRFGSPFLGAYVAAKHGVEGLSESLRRELMVYGIDVIIVGPGAVATSIWNKVQDPGAPIYQGTVWAGPMKSIVGELAAEGRAGYTPEQIGETVFTALTTKRPCVRYAPVQKKFARYTLPLLLPKRFVDWWIARGAGLLPPR